MSRKRIVVLGILATAPIFFLIGVGFYHLWQTNWLFWAWWPMMACIAGAYVLAWRWQKGMRRQIADEPPPLHYTDRDELAWKHVEERIRNTDKVTVDELSGLQLYVDEAQGMARELAAIYHPEATDPVSNLTLPEVLGVVELAAHDLGDIAKTYLPGGHLLTLDHVRQARQAHKWYKRASTTFWAASAVIDPIRTGMRYLAAQAGLGKPFDLLKDNVFLWFYAQFVRRMGHYLIELYSGRLRIGVERYRQLQAEHAEEKANEDSKPAVPGQMIVVNADGPMAAQARGVTVAVVGQVKAGKSSVINALLGDRRAVTDVIPATRGISRYELRAPNGSKLILLDTVGYNQAGPDADQFDNTVEAARESDLLFFVVHAGNPGRDADVKLWHDLKDYFMDRPELKMPPVLLVMTHVDLLSPAMEWAPPYDWRNPKRPKEKNISEAAQVVSEQFGEGYAAIVPVCSAEGKTWGIEEELVPEMVGLLGEARAVSFVRCLEAEADEGKIRKVMDQLFAAGKALLGSLR
jgi:uncharacterized protein